MSLTVFYSWQSDSPSETNRNFIESVLKNVIERLGRDVELQESLREEEVVLDKDTKGVPGTPPIVDTILNKISNCCVFVPDLTFVGRTDAGRPIPNPNVLIEYGWAMKVLGHAAIVPLMNTAFGEPNADTLPFDMRHLRHPATYHLQTTDDPQTRSRVKRELVDQMIDHVKLAISQRLPSTASAPPFEGTPSTENPSVFFKKGEAFLRAARFGSEVKELVVPPVQHLFLRLVPATPSSTIRSSQMALDHVRAGELWPMADGVRSTSYGRNHYGGFCYDGNEGQILYLSQLLTTGELWGIDALTIDAKAVRQFSGVDFAYFASTLVEEIFAFTLTNYLGFARKTLHLKPPVRLIAGATDVKGYRMAIRGGYDGIVVRDHIVYEDSIGNLDTPATTILKPLYEYFWEECGLKRPDVKIYK